MNGASKEDPVVYESLRNEIISTQNTRTNLIVYMYTVYVVLFGLGVERSRVFFVLSFVILISFQAKINRSKYTIVRISTYIRVFFESDDSESNIHWETSNMDETTAGFKKKMDNKLASIISGTGSVQLGILSTSCYIIFLLYEITSKNVTTSIPLFADIIMTVVSFFGVYVLYTLYKDYNVKPDEIRIMEEGYQEFKRKVYSKESGDLECSAKE